MPRRTRETLRGGGKWVKKRAGVALEPGARLDLNGHSITGDDFGSNQAVACRRGRCEITGPGEINDCHTGILGTGPRDAVIASDVTVRDNALAGIAASKLKVTGLTATGNGGTGILADRVRGTGVLASANAGSGIFAGTVRVSGLVADGNGSMGVRATKVALRDAEVLGNDDPGTGIDVGALRRPRLVDSVCGASQVLGATLGTSWGV